ncbi:hypothetical protein U9M48_037452 [Paspalum notatum var. saurae]|uniref:Reverse transcriptase zinc-binding domain-containing protein n=1 Tax=Paspalum notatum var. saurae TaxID=547442 RepID=A0AAQ3XB25_PASNO
MAQLQCRVDRLSGRAGAVLLSGQRGGLSPQSPRSTKHSPAPAPPTRSPRPRTHGVSAEATCPQRRPSGGDIPPDRIGSPADLARASIACVAFRRLIGDPSFLRQYRSLHSPPLLGFIDADGRGFQPAEAPHPCAALGRALARAADFSIEDYLPRVTGSSWHIQEVRDGRVLIECFPGPEDNEPTFHQLAVCDPMARRCLLLPPIPDDLLASVQVRKQDLECCVNLLVPSGEEDDDTSFRVIRRMDFTEMVVAFIFSSASGLWSAGASVKSIRPRDRLVRFCSSYMYGCFYWKVIDDTLWNKWLRLDISSMEFSAVDLSPLQDGCNDIIVEAGEGRLGMFTVDVRVCTAAGGDKLKTGLLYPLLRGSEESLNEETKFIWRSRAPPRVQFFGWLVHKERIQCKVNLYTKRIVEDPVCDCCQGGPETTDHVLFRCAFARQFWNWLGIALPAQGRVYLQELRRPDDVPERHFDTFVLLCC